jgi:hypothetical protein
VVPAPQLPSWSPQVTVGQGPAAGPFRLHRGRGGLGGRGRLPARRGAEVWVHQSPGGLPGLVNVQKTMERSTIFHGKIHYKLWKITIFNGKTHYFYGHVQ